MKRFSQWHDDGGGAQAPDCPDCGEPVRPAGAPQNAMFRGVANLPWNSGWDGRCASCGAVFEHRQVTLGTYAVGDDGYASVGIGAPASARFIAGRPFREVRARPQPVPLRTFIDEGVVFAGVEIIVAEADFGEPPVERKITLTVDELRAIVEALDGPLRPVAEQWGWSVDDT